VNRTNGTTLHQRVAGEGRPLVVLPGLGLDGAVMAAAFEPVFAGPEGDGVCRIYLDLPGHGGSPAVGSTSDDVLDAVRSTLEELSGGMPYLLAGHSYGGYLAYGLARRVPERVAGLLMVTSAGRVAPEVERDLAGVQPPDPEPGWLDAVSGEQREAGLDDYFAHAVGRQSSDVGRRMAAAFAACGPQDEPYLQRLRAEGFALRDEDEAFCYGGPASVLAGRRDRTVGYRDSFRLLDSLPAATFTVLPDAGHYLPFERPEAFAMLVLEWLAQAGGGAS
jgi:pimeloyl-ACP methyl ester carboxylesterase